MERLKWEEGFSSQFHESWHRFMKEIIESEEVANIYKYLKSESSKGAKLTPLSKDVFASFNIDLNSLKVVMCAMDVYPQYRNNLPVANGIAFDCSLYGKISPSLERLYEGIEDDCYDGLNLNYEKSLNLDYLINQGVMLTNAALTCERDKSGKHVEIWRPFWKLVFEKVFATENGLIFIFLGKDAHYLERYTTPFIHHVLKCEHPSFAARNERKLNHENVFSKANTIIEQNNGKEFKINWLNEEPVPWN